MTAKEFFLNEVIKQAAKAGEVNILEVGCGTARYVPSLLKNAKDIKLNYVGIEPIESSYQVALKNLAGVPNAKVYNELAYGTFDELTESSFDIVISFSVLEHVKDLPAFMKLSARYCKSGGIMIHRYDLGHALYPGSLKERFHVWLGNTLPKVLPERKFVRYVPLAEVEDLFVANGCSLTKRTHHQLPDFKKLQKVMSAHSQPDAPLEEMYRWELDNADIFDQLVGSEREQLFPTIAVWGVKH